MPASLRLYGLVAASLAVASSGCQNLAPDESGLEASPIAAEPQEGEGEGEGDAEGELRAALDAAPEPPPLPGSTEGCPDGMVRVEGEYCPAVVQECLEHHPEYLRDRGKRKTVSERCLRYKSESRCAVKKRVKMSFCMDRHEYPNQVGEIPRVLTSWHEATKECAAQGKRLCTEDEFNFACEGPEMRPYAYGFERDAAKCNQDQEYRYPDHSRVLPHYEKCLETPWCREELARLDQRRRIGDSPECVSWAGVYDLNGNVNEWVRRPEEEAPYRSGLKGGWWGPIRSRCRPTTTFHKEDDYGYEVGFRCCSDASL